MHTQHPDRSIATCRALVHPYERPEPEHKEIPSSPVHKPYLAMIQKAILLFNPEKGQCLFSPLVVSLSGGMSGPTRHYYYIC